MARPPKQLAPKRRGTIVFGVSTDRKLRMFVAIEPPESVRELLSRLPKRIRGINWTPPDQYHLTLRFLGDIEVDRIEAIRDALSRIRVESFLLPVAEAGTFPVRRPARVIWIGVGTGDPRLFQLRQKIDDALLACGLDLDVRSFHPHFTLGRCTHETKPSAVAGFLRGLEGFEGPLFRVESFVLFRSELQPGGAVHTALAEFPLKAV